MNFSNWLASHRRFVLVLLAALAAGGLAAAWHLPVSLFPRVDFPRVALSADSGDRDVDLMVTQVTAPLEEAARSVPGARSIRSRSSRGSAELQIDFDWGNDMVTALLQVQAAIAEVSPRLPPGTSVSARRMDPTVFPILGYSLVSKTRSPTELGDIASFQIRPACLRVAGVAKVGVQGAPSEEFRVTVDPALLAQHGLAMSDIAAALSGSIALQSLGRVEDHGKLLLVLATNSTRSERDISATVVRGSPSGVTRLGDIASISRESAPRWTRVTADGQDAVLIQVYQQTNGNTVQIASDIEAQLASLRAKLPPDVHFATWYDQSRLIQASAASLREAVLIGTAFAALVLLVFLRNFRVTLLAAVVVPSVLASTCLLLFALGESLNMMTLGGMAAAVGLIIDDVIVMAEHIEARLRARDSSLNGAPHPALLAASDFTRPLLGASLATIIIHVPPVFLSGVTGEFFRALSLTMAVSLIVSFFVAWLVVPIFAERFRLGLSTPKPHHEHDALSRLYGRILAPMLRRRWLSGFISLVLVGSAIAAGSIVYPMLGSGFMPPMDEGGFVLDYRSAAGTSLEETDRLLRQVELILRSTPEVETYSRRTGLQLGGGLTEAHEGDFFVRLKPLPRRDVETVMDDIRNRVARRVPALKIELLQLMEDLIGDLTGVPQPIEIKIASEDQANLTEIATRVAAALNSVPGIVDVNDGLLVSGNALDIRIDLERAAVEGIDPATAAAAISQALSGNVVTEVKDESLPRMLGIRVWTPRTTRTKTEDLLAVRIAAKDGHQFPLSRVGTVTIRTGQPQIERQNLQRIVAVTARTSGIDLGTGIARVQRLLADSALLTPTGADRPLPVELGGVYWQQRIAFRGLLGVFFSAVVLVFLLMVLWFESLRVALAITFTSLLAIPGVALGLLVTGAEVDISSMMGLAMILGSVTEVSVFLVAAFFSKGHD